LSSIEKWAERVYAETDFGKSIATSLAGVVGLAVYLLLGDWAIAAFAAVIFFPIARLTATAIHTRVARNAKRRERRSDAEHLFGTLSSEEQSVVEEFVRVGGCTMTWGQANRSPISSSAIESLIQREVLSTSMTADGMRETFVLDPALFEVGVRRAKSLKSS
jgi:ABC-type multidrug transport system fused ATPase/permease subunit